MRLQIYAYKRPIILPIARLLSSCTANNLNDVSVAWRIYRDRDMKWGLPSNWVAFITSLKALARRCDNPITLTWNFNTGYPAEVDLPALTKRQAKSCSARKDAYWKDDFVRETFCVNLA